MVAFDRIDHAVFGLLVGLAAAWICHQARRLREDEAVPARGIAALVLLSLGVDLLLGSLILLLGADGTQDGLLYLDIRRRNAAGAASCVVATIACWLALERYR